MKDKKANTELIESTEEAWEDRKLGSDEAYAKVSSQSADEVDDALGLKMISIRLSNDLIESFKLLGIRHGMGYQPLMREALKRFADGEFKMIAKEILEEQSKAKKESEASEKKAA